MDRDRRYNLRSVVGKSRRIIEDDIAKKLIYYGITKKADPIPAENLQHLSEEDKIIKIKLEKAIDKEKCAVTNYQKALDRYIRHVGFTFINRIAALRAMEVRGLITETILRKSEYGGMSLRERGIHEKNHDLTPDLVLEESLKDAFREVTKEIKVLFDLESEYSIIFPSSKALRDIILLLSEDVTDDDWMQDDIIGWIYQYYNEDARQEFKKSKRSPTADDIPVINQFYTPHWVVRVLTDNTLGRLWLEQKDRCPYFLEQNGHNKLIEKRDNISHNSDEDNFKTWLKSPSGQKVDNFCSYLIPNVNKHSPRKTKRAREIKVLDPACGSGHFLIYAFDVLYRIYLEDEPNTPAKEIPSLILENNLFGVDIDLRAVQLAALSLYLKAKSYNPSIIITNMNLVCADSHIAPGKRKEFLNRFKDSPELQEIFSKTFEDLNNTNELGSLLKVRKPLEILLNNVQQVRFTLDNDKLVEFPQIHTINGMLQELKVFEQESMENQDMGSLLFVTEAEKSVGLLSIISQKYDIILMNPPYGKMPKLTKKYLQKHYSRTKNDLYAAFIELSIDLNVPNGFVGMLTSNTFMFLKQFQKVREELLLNEATPENLLDMGFGILDGATVETAATILRKNDKSPNSQLNDKSCNFCRLSIFDTDNKETKFRDSIFETYESKNSNELWFRVFYNSLKNVPGFAYAYWASESLRNLFNLYPPLDKDVAGIKNEIKISDVKQGLSTADGKRFTRCFYEVEDHENWVPYLDGGSYKKFYSDFHRVVYWENEGESIKNYIIKRYPYLEGKWQWVVKNSDFYFKDGLSWGNKPSPNKHYFPFRNLPEGCIFTIGGMGCFPLQDINKFNIMAIMCSKLAYFLLSLYSSEHNWEASTISKFPINLSSSILSEYGKEAHDILRECDTGNEVSTIFVKPWIIQVLNNFSLDDPLYHNRLSKQFKWETWASLKESREIVGNKEDSLIKLGKLCIKKEDFLNERINVLQELIDKEVFSIYEISNEDIDLIERELFLRKSGRKTKEFNDTNERIKNHIMNLFSYYAKVSIEDDEDGIIPIKQLFDDVQKKLVQDFGQERLDDILNEFHKIFGKSLNDWLAEDYFDYHVTLYKRRPIYWQLTSSKFSKNRTKLPGSFSCYVNYRKLNKDTIPKIIAHHLNTVIESAKVEKKRVMTDLEKAKIEGDRKKINLKSKKYEETANIVEELESFENALNKIRSPHENKTKLPKNPKWIQEKMKEVRDDGWNPVIDYGVRVNIEPLKEAQILPRSADRVK